MRMLQKKLSQQYQQFLPSLKTEDTAVFAGKMPPVSLNTKSPKRIPLRTQLVNKVLYSIILFQNNIKEV